VTYPLSDDAGSDTARSQFVDNLQSLFKNLKEESASDDRMDITAVNNESELAELLTAKLGEDNQHPTSVDDRLEALLNGICG